VRCDCAAHCEVLEHVRLTDNHIQPVTKGAGYMIDVMVWFVSSMLLV